MSPLLTTLVTSLATDVDDIKIVFNESSLTTLKIVIGLILFGIALDTDVEDFKRAARRPGTIAIGVAAQFVLLNPLVAVLAGAGAVRAWKTRDSIGLMALATSKIAVPIKMTPSSACAVSASGAVAISVKMPAWASAGGTST